MLGFLQAYFTRWICPVLLYYCIISIANNEVEPSSKTNNVIKLKCSIFRNPSNDEFPHRGRLHSKNATHKVWSTRSWSKQHFTTVHGSEQYCPKSGRWQNDGLDINNISRCFRSPNHSIETAHFKPGKATKYLWKHAFNAKEVLVWAAAPFRHSSEVLEERQQSAL